MSLIEEKSCGAIIIKDNKVLLVHGKDSRFWGFPKGHMEIGETETETVLREIKEEVGLDILIDDRYRYELSYMLKNNILKKVVLFKAKPLNCEINKQESEIDNIKWCDFKAALDLLTFDEWKNVFIKFINDLERDKL